MTGAMRKFICLACGYVYDEALGDPDGGLPAGTRFEDIPDDWMCPTCGVGKADFEPYVESAAPATPAAAIAPTQRASRDAGLPVVIVGAGTAGWAVAAALRARDTALPIVLVTACDGCLYAKPRLSVAFAQGQSAQSLISEPGPEAAARMGVRLMADTWVSGIDAPRRRLRTTHGALRYSALVLAHGATPAPLPLDPASARLTWRINHIEHYARFRTALGESAKRVAIIGAGLVGCELADDLAGAGHAVTLLDIASRPLATLADESTSARLLGALADTGVRFVGSARLTRIERRDTALVLSGDFGTLEADLAIAATGLVTSERLARSAALAFDRGICVDAASMQSSAAGIYALGDCASFGGRAFRFIEPIHRQAAVIADHVLEKESQGFEVRTVPVRLKSRSLPLTLALAA